MKIENFPVQMLLLFSVSFQDMHYHFHLSNDDLEIV